MHAATSLSTEQLDQAFLVLERVDQAHSVPEFAELTLEALGSVFGYRNTTFFAGPSYHRLFQDQAPLLNGKQRNLIHEYRARWCYHDVFASAPQAAVLRRRYAASLDVTEATAGNASYLGWLAEHGIESLSAIRVGPGGQEALFGIFGPLGLVGPQHLAVLRRLGRQLDAISRHLPWREQPAPEVPALSPRLAQAAELVGRGQSNAEIAQSMSLSEDTVKKYVSKLLTTAGARSRTELALILRAQR